MLWYRIVTSRRYCYRDVGTVIITQIHVNLNFCLTCVKAPNINLGANGGAVDQVIGHSLGPKRC